MKTRRLTKKEMWIFAIGQLGWSILGGIINTWLVTFYLPTQGSVEAGAKFYVPTGLIIFGVLTVFGLITFICRIFDAAERRTEYQYRYDREWNGGPFHKWDTPSFRIPASVR